MPGVPSVGDHPPVALKGEAVLLSRSLKAKDDHIRSLQLLHWVEGTRIVFSFWNTRDATDR